MNYFMWKANYDRFVFFPFQVSRNISHTYHAWKIHSLKVWTMKGVKNKNKILEQRPVIYLLYLFFNQLTGVSRVIIFNIFTMDDTLVWKATLSVSFKKIHFQRFQNNKHLDQSNFPEWWFLFKRCINYC